MFCVLLIHYLKYSFSTTILWAIFLIQHFLAKGLKSETKKYIEMFGC